jgi:autotransporter-associated beta strand protein
MRMKRFNFRACAWLLCLTLPSALMAAPPDLTATNVIASIDRTYTYNLGPTGLRGWIYVGGGERGEGTITVESRQILVTAASAPANAVLAVNDVILGAMAGSTGSVPLFTNDCRKAFAMAIGEAEKAGAGTLRVKRWRAGVSSDVNIAIPVMGEYSSTAPYSCPKSALILTNAVNKFVAQLVADSNFLNNGQLFSRSIHALAFLSGVTSNHPNYATVQSRLQTYARARAASGPDTGSLRVWENAYSCLFLSEYYFSTGDTNVIPGIVKYTDSLANSQSMYGTYGHDPAMPRPDSTGRHNIGYGPVNQVGIIGGLGMVMGKKALEAAGKPLNPELTQAIQRSNGVLTWFANKGGIPYGEHDPVVDTYESNGKNASSAMFFSLQTNSVAQTEFYTRLSVSGFNSREYGHTGQGFSYLWGTLGANVGGPLATAEYLKNVRWHLDLSRRTDGSFAYDGQEAFGPGVTADGTYLGTSSYNDLNATAIYILTYSLPLKRLYITGKNANPSNTLDSAKVAHAIAATTFKQNIASRSVAELTAALSDYDPIVRHNAATELGKRSVSAGELSTLRSMLTDTNANARMGACQALGLLKDTAALPLLVQRLDKTSESNSWVRALAANAIRYFPPATASVHLETLMTDFVTNATDTAVIDWDDPFQYSNGNLGFLLFGDDIYGWMINGGASLAAYTINAPPNLLYSALRTGFKHPESKARNGPTTFALNRLSLTQVQALLPDVIDLAQHECQVDRMWGSEVRGKAITLLGKYRITEGAEVALSVLNVVPGFTHSASAYINPALDLMDSYGDAARWTLPQLGIYRDTWDPNDNSYPSYVYPNLLESIASIENAITAPAQNLGLAVAHSQIVSTTGTPIVVTLAGASPRRLVTFLNITAPAHGTLTGTAPLLTYTPVNGYTGLDRFTFQVTDGLTTSKTATVSIIVGTAGTGLKGEYYDNPDFTNLQLTRTDAQINFDWGTGSPDALLGADTFSVRWSGLLLVPETANYMFSSLSSEGMRLYVNGTRVIDNFVDQSTCWTDGTPINLIQGQLADILIEYYEKTNNAVAKLKWTGPSFAGVNGAIIPQSYLFDGSTITNRPAFAFAQTLNTDKNIAIPITLQGTGGSLTYTVLTQPPNGTLSGTPPNLTYTPNTNFVGTDSFTFRVNNGFTNSLPATITIGVQAGPLAHFTWTTSTSGNWSDASKWTPGVPDAAGQPNYALNFNSFGIYTVTNNLNNGFQLNQLNVAVSVTIDGTRSLSFVGNGSSQPTFNNNGGALVTVITPIQLSALTQFGGSVSSAGKVVLTKRITGSGGLIKSGAGKLCIYGVDSNNYSGGTIVNSGTLILGAYVDGIGSLDTINPLGTGTVTLNSGTIELQRVSANHPLIVNGGTLFSDNGWGATWSGAVTLNQTLTARCNWPLTFSGAVSGNAGIIKTGNNTLTLSVANSYAGTTEIREGTLTCNTSSALGNGPLVITSPGKANLNFSGTRSIASLTLNGTIMPPGTYGSTASAAANKNDTYFSGSGIVNVSAVTSNSVPTANAQCVTTPVNTAKGITLTGSDPENTPLTYTIVTQPANGTLTGTPPNVNYTPVTDYAGIDSFTFKVNDGTNNSAVAVVSIAVATPNRPPVVNAGQSKTINFAEQSLLPGLWYGTVVGSTNWITPNPKTLLLTNVAAYTENAIADNTTEVYSGRIYDADGAIRFTEDIDDSTRIWIDGVLKLSSNNWNDRISTTNLNLTPGWHDIEIRIGNGSGGSGPHSNPGIGFDPNGGTTWRTLQDPGNGSLLTVFYGYAVNIEGTVSDPDNNQLTTMWSVVSPTNAAVIFSNAAVTNTTVTFGTAGEYVLRLTADDGFIQSYQDVTISVVIPTVTAPTGLVATAVSSTQINLSWGDTNIHETGFVIERSLTNTTGFAVLGNAAANATAYSDTTVGPGETWYYRVTATNTLFSSTPSAVASATTPKLPATVQLGNLSLTYNGTARTVSYTTTPTGLAVAVTYNGQAPAPTNAGSYAVTGTVVSATYQGATNGTLVVAKATPTVTAWPTAASISEGQALSLATLTGGSASVAGTFSYNAPATVPPIGVYTAAVTFAASDSLNYVSVGGTVVVTVTEVPVPVPGVVGLSQAAAVAMLTASNLVVGSVTNVYHATVPAGAVISQNPAAGALVFEGTSVDLVISLGPKTVATVALGNLTQTYDGTARIVTATTTPDGLTVEITYNGSTLAPTNAGSYAVIGTVISEMYQGTTNATLVVAKATPTVTAWPTAAPILLGQALSAATLTGGTASVTGSFAYDAPATVPPAGIYAAAVTFTPTASVNYSNVLGSVNVTVVNPHVLPFYEPFEERVTGNLHGQYGWVASHASVQESLVFAGTKACSITNEAGIVTHTFSDGRTKVWADMRVKLFPSVEAPVPFADSTANVFALTNGMLMAFNGTNVVQTGTTVGQGTWVHLTIMNDYTTKKWDLYVNAYKIGRYGFYNTNVVAFTMYGVKGGNSALDNLAITPTAPAGLGRATLITFR